MTSISNMKIGRKIATVLGGIVLLLAGLSALSLWGTSTNERQALLMNQRLTKARLAEEVDADTWAIAADVEKMVLNKKASSEIVDDVATHKTHRGAANDEYRALADNPASIQQGADMAQMIQSASEASKATIDQIAAGRLADALKEFEVYNAVAVKLGAKANEASQFQQSRVVEADKSNKETSSTIWISLIAGSLFAVAGAFFGGIVLTRGIATPLTEVTTNLEQIAQGDLSKDSSSELQKRQDEIGTLARGMQTMTVALRKMIQEISGGILVLSSSSTELMTSSAQMTTGSRHASDKAHSVSAAAEEMSSNITSVARGHGGNNHKPGSRLHGYRANDRRRSARLRRIPKKPARLRQKRPGRRRNYRTDQPTRPGGARDRESDRNHHRNLVSNQPAGAECND